VSVRSLQRQPVLKIGPVTWAHICKPAVLETLKSWLELQLFSDEWAAQLNAPLSGELKTSLKITKSEVLS